jgi:hypothetical protein
MTITKKMKSRIGFNLALAFVITLAACNNTQDNTNSSQGTLRILATDDPFPFDSVAAATMTVSKIELRSTSESYITVLENPVTLNLVELKNGITATLTDLSVPTGNYDQIRLIVTEASVDLKNGSHFEMKVPSGSSSGLKIFISPSIQVTSELSTDVLLDFDLSRSFTPQGSSKNMSEISGFHFHPVIRASNLTTAGTVSGKITSDQGTPDAYGDDRPIQNAVVTVSQDDAVISIASTDAQGKYSLIGLPEGDYRMEVSAEGFEKKEYETIQIVKGNVLTMDSILSLNQ